MCGSSPGLFGMLTFDRPHHVTRDAPFLLLFRGLLGPNDSRTLLVQESRAQALNSLVGLRFWRYLPIYYLMAAPQHVDCPEIPIALLELPPFSTVAVKVLQLVASNVSELKALSNLIGSDPAFAGAILRIINSPLFGMRKQISSVFDATVLLGLERIKGVALTIGIRTYLHETLEVPAIKACWRHSLACAMIAGELARGSEVKEDVAFTAGVIHDIGRLALAVVTCPPTPHTS